MFGNVTALNGLHSHLMRVEGKQRAVDERRWETRLQVWWGVFVATKEPAALRPICHPPLEILGTRAPPLTSTTSHKPSDPENHSLSEALGGWIRKEGGTSS